jgi:hypothetical protein
VGEAVRSWAFGCSWNYLFIKKKKNPEVNDQMFLSIAYRSGTQTAIILFPV